MNTPVKSAPLINQASVVHVQVNNGLWYVLRHRTEPRTVALMLEDMRHEGYEAYLPQLLRRRRVMRGGRLGTKLEWVSEPLFRGYVFVRCMENLAPSRPMTRIYGIEGRDAVGAVRPMLIDAMRAGETSVQGMTGRVDGEAEKHVPADEWRVALTAGSEVEVVACGTFLRAVVTANDGAGRLRALIALFGRYTPITVDLPTKVRAVGS